MIRENTVVDLNTWNQANADPILRAPDDQLGVYVAGKYGAEYFMDVFTNMRRGIELSTECLKRGYAPFVPWLDYQLLLRCGLTEAQLKAYSMAWLRRADAVLVQTVDYKTSKGTLAEIAEAERLGIPVFYSLDDLGRWAADAVVVCDAATLALRRGQALIIDELAEVDVEDNGLTQLPFSIVEHLKCTPLDCASFNAAAERIDEILKSMRGTDIGHSVQTNIGMLAREHGKACSAALEGDAAKPGALHHALCRLAAYAYRFVLWLPLEGDDGISNDRYGTTSNDRGWVAMVCVSATHSVGDFGGSGMAVYNDKKNLTIIGSEVADAIETVRLMANDRRSLGDVLEKLTRVFAVAFCAAAAINASELAAH